MKEIKNKKKFIISIFSFVLFSFLLAFSAGSADWWVNLIAGIVFGFLATVLVRSFFK